MKANEEYLRHVRDAQGTCIDQSRAHSTLYSLGPDRLAPEGLYYSPNLGNHLDRILITLILLRRIEKDQAAATLVQHTIQHLVQDHLGQSW